MNAIAAPAAPPAAGFQLVDIHELAAQIADQASADLIQRQCCRVRSGERDWYDLKSCGLDDWAYVDRAVAYLERRGDSARFRLVRCKAFPSLVRFEGA